MPAYERILLLGAAGQVGGGLGAMLPALGAVTAPGRSELDLTDHASLRRAIADLAPDLIVNAAAYTAVDRAEEEAELAEAVNATAPGVIAEEAARGGARVVHYSTDYVFDGTKAAPYTPDDPPRPLCVYGRTKLAGEEAIRTGGAEHLILRTGWIYGLTGHNFLRTMLRLARNGREPHVVDDQVGAPTWSRTLAFATAAILARIATDDAWARHTGTYHLTAAGATSWHAFAERIFDIVLGPDAPPVRAIPTSAYPTAATRPPSSRLDCSATTRAFSVTLPPWERDLEACLAGVAIDAG